MRLARVALVAALMTGRIVMGASAEKTTGVGRQLRTYCDPVCELKSQDSAFSLLVEAYREFQSSKIQADYENRLVAADSMSDERGSLIIKSSSEGLQTLRSFVVMLARQERELRLEQLQTEVVNFQTAYNCARRSDEEHAGVSVANNVDTTAAATQLRQFVLVSSGSPAAVDTAARPLPASTVLLDVQPALPDETALVEPCE